jgi:uncharacterized SAM-binding protein YcdF (DUF218 family)/cyclophilin family peptidyl-prolyl cis-trans isomerase
LLGETCICFIYRVDPGAPPKFAGTEDAMVVLGCRIVDGEPSAALQRRLEQAARVHAKYPDLAVIMSGGKLWEGHAECQVMAHWWRESGRSSEKLFEEPESLTTRQNARQVAKLCQELQYRSVVLVTCDFHMKRAQRLFEKHGLITTPAPAVTKRSAWANFRLMVREEGARILGFFSACLFALSCGTGSESKAQRAPEPAAQSSTAEKAASTAQNLSEEDLRKLVHSKGGADAALMTRLLLSDTSSDQSARRWAPFALGLSCKPKQAEETTAQLVTTVASWLSDTTLPHFDHLQGATWAIGSCGSKTAEGVLRGWLTPDPALKSTKLTDAAVLGLGVLADQQGTLSEQTQTALLDAASREGRADYLQPLGRIGRLSDAVGAHILEVTGTLLSKDDRSGIRHALFALGSAGQSATAPLSEVLLSENFTPEERAAAAQALSRLGLEGQKSLDQTLRDLLSRGLPTAYDRPLWVTLRAIFEGLDRAQAAKKPLGELSALILPEASTSTDPADRPKRAQRRRQIWLRCAAARLLAEGRYEFAPLLNCDPEKGREFQLAQLAVLGKEPISGKRAKVYEAYLKSADPVVAQAALRLLAEHPEITSASQKLEAALKEGAPGTQATAAQIIAAYPSRAFENKDSEGPAESIVSALKELLILREHQPVAAETRAATIKAAGALGALSLKPEIEVLCDGPSEALWQPAESAMALLGTPEITCPRQRPAPPKSSKEFGGQTTIEIDSDVGQLLLHLDGRDAPVSAAHFLQKVESGFYDGIVVHGTRAGFAVQWGDPDGDGYQDGASTQLPHEVSPRPFSALSFGMSAFSPGSHDAQIFVVLSDAPQLQGSRVHLGRAEGPWHLLIVGDVFHSVKRR